MDREFVYVPINELRPRDVYELLCSTVQPRPIAFVSTLSTAGEPNLAPFSFFMAGGSRPPSLVFCPVLGKEGRPKDTLRNIEETGEFVVNLVDRPMAEGMNATSFEYPPGFNEWEVSGFRQIESRFVRPNRVAESPVQYECKLFQVIRHGAGTSGTVYVIGEIVAAHILSAFWLDGEFNTESFRPISRLGGPDYLDTESGERFRMPRPVKP